MGDTRLQSFRLTTDELAGSPLAPNILPVLMHARLFGIPLEFVNFVIALITFSCSYPSVFWRVNKAFSLWFSLHFIFYIADFIFSYLEFCILFRIQETNHHSIRPIGLGAHLSALYPKIFFHPLSIIAEYLVTIVLMHMGPVILYSYGYQKYFVAVKTLQNKNRERAQNAVSDDYGEIRRQQRVEDSVNDLCCSGYGPNVIATLYLIVLAGVKIPAIVGTINLYEHDQKPLLLTCFAVNAAYLFSWLIFWVGFTFKGYWDFKVLYRVQEFLNIQSAHKLNFGTIAGKAPSELKNALIMMQGDHMYVTDDPLAKQSLMRHALKTNTHDEVYWLRANQSPTTRKAIFEEGKGTPEMTRLLGASVRRQSSGNTPLIGNQSPTILTYHHPNRSLRGLPPQPPHSMVNYADDSMMQQNFGTIQRSQYGPGMRAVNLQTATLGRPHHPESYASINKNAAFVNTPNSIQRRESHNRGDNIENVTYGNNALYSTYARTLQQNLHYMPSQNPTNPIYGTYATQQRQSSEPIHNGHTENGINSVKASPLLNDKKLNNTPRDLTYQRLGNLSSFNTSNPNRPQVNARLPPTGLNSQTQQTNVIYKPTISASSSQQDSCFTPVSSTSQGSAGNFSSSHTPTASSPIASARFNGTSSQVYGRIDHETRGGSEPHNSNIYGTQTLTKSSLSTGSTSKIGVTPLRMPIKSTTVSITRHHDDSANYSLSSSNDSADKKMTSNNFNPEYATSVV
uniref:Uncharacterized protein n=2 Tax=Panagrolaimus sp. PS1159 TaxID=55785 RepID=A0AC35G523_9BILA